MPGNRTPGRKSKACMMKAGMWQWLVTLPGLLDVRDVWYFHHTFAQNDHVYFQAWISQKHTFCNEK